VLRRYGAGNSDVGTVSSSHNNASHQSLSNKKRR